MLKAILSFFFPRGNLITPCYKSELNFNSKESAIGSISHRKKNDYTWFETDEFIVLLSDIYKLRDRSVVGHYPTPTAVEKEKSANPSGFPHTHSLTNPSFESLPDMAFLINHEKFQLVWILRPVHLSWVLVVRKYIRGLIIPHPRAFELFKNGSFLFPTI